ncbi:hypothetical protein [Sulfuricurvum sp.]|uniref:hypothetical protein n=1 Tax=Sulfuricurvum sp. TaxID=2025608 RepID=UPI00261B7E8A|nr:hypothetical protein [Sulfuricurvum sp.]MDD4950575.1 hypothetical protein [Sulfuricurvum sp.]
MSKIDKLIIAGCEQALKDNKTHFASERALYEHFGVSPAALTHERKAKIQELGIVWNKHETARTSEEVDVDIEARCKQTLKDNKTYFTSKQALCEYLGIGSKALTDERKATIRELGITWDNGRTSKEVDVDIKTKCEQALKDNKTHFASELALYAHLGIGSKVLTDERKAMMRELGITWDKGRTLKEVDTDIKIKCEQALKDKKTYFTSKQALCGYLGIGGKVLTDERKAMIQKLGITWDKGRNSKEVDVDIKTKCKQALKDNKTYFTSKKALCGYLEVGSKILTDERKAIIREFGITWDNGRTLKEVDTDIKTKCEQALKDNKTHFASEKALCGYLGIGSKVLTDERKAMIREFGITHSSGVTLSENILLALGEAKLRELKLESVDALVEFSEDVLARVIQGHKLISESHRAIKATSRQIMDYKTAEIKGIVEEAASILILSGYDDFWIMEIKFQLYLGGHYITESSILRALKSLGYDITTTQKDHIDKRLRLALRAASEDILNINYVETLPTINTSEDANIYIKQKIKKQFKNLWKEYALFMVKNNLLGSVSKTPIPLGWDGTIESLAGINESYARAFFLDDEHIETLDTMGYEGIAALALLASRGAKDNLPRMFWSIGIRARAFFIWLNKKGYAVFHPKYVIYTGADMASKTIELLTKDHPVITLYNNIISNNAINQNPAITKKFKQKNVVNHARYLALASDPKSNLLALTQEDIIEYCESTKGYAKVSGTIAHQEFIFDLLYCNGNEKAIRPKEDISLESWFNSEIHKKIRTISDNTTHWYADITRAALEIANFRLTEEKYAIGTIKTFLKHYIFLLEFLSLFNHKLNRTELSKALTPYINDDNMQMFKWAKERNEGKKYRGATSSFKLLFDRLSPESEYQGLFTQAMKLKNEQSERKLLRKGMELAVYHTLQEVARNIPPMSNTYTLKRTASNKDRSILDLSWWPLADTGLSPILPVFEWMMSKLPRRKKHLRYADVNEFLQYSDSGNLLGIYFSTDKNFNNPSLFIPIITLRLLFNPEEIAFLEKYVNYIKAAYSHISPISFDGGNFDEIKPLFPHHNRNDVVAENIVNGYHKKCMIATQIEVNRLAKDGVFNSYYSKDEQERMRGFLGDLELVQLRDGSRKSFEIPKTLEGIGLITDSIAEANLTDSQGIHNLRHAGATALLQLGLDLTQIMIITGHKSEKVLFDIYLHPEGAGLAEVLQSSFTQLKDLSGSPKKISDGFINKVFKILIESQDPELILSTLRGNGFFCMSRNIKNMDTEIFGQARKYTADGLVENGLELASQFHPATWKASDTCICPVDKRCPDGTNGCCALCPLGLFNIIHIKGIIKAFQEAMIQMKLLNNKIVECKLSGKDGHLEQMKKEHHQLVSEIIGWLDVIQKLEYQLNSNKDDTGISNLPVIQENITLTGYREVTIDQAMMETIIMGREIQSESVTDDNYTARLSHKICLTAAKNYDTDTLSKMEREGLDWLINDYNACEIDQQRALLERFTSGNSAPLNKEIQLSSKLIKE